MITLHCNMMPYLHSGSNGVDMFWFISYYYYKLLLFERGYSVYLHKEHALMATRYIIFTGALIIPSIEHNPTK